MEPGFRYLASDPKASTSVLGSGKSMQAGIPAAFKMTFGAWGVVLCQFTLQIQNLAFYRQSSIAASHETSTPHNFYCFFLFNTSY